MCELVILSKQDLEKLLKDLLSEFKTTNVVSSDQIRNDKMNQKEAAEYLGVTQATLIRWKKEGRVPCDQLPGSTKITYYKSQLKSVFQRNSVTLKTER